MSDTVVQAPIEKVSMKDVDKLVGRYAIFYRNNVKTPGKILRIDTAEKRIIFEILSGPDAGKKKSSKYDEAQTADVYNEDNKVLALLET